MKKLLALLTILMLLIPIVCFAEIDYEIDYEMCTDDELIEIIEKANAELARRRADEDAKLILSERGITVYLDVVTTSGKYGKIQFLIISEKDYDGNFRFNFYINGKNIGAKAVEFLGTATTKVEFTFNLEDADILSTDDIETIGFGQMEIRHSTNYANGFMLEKGITLLMK